MNCNRFCKIQQCVNEFGTTDQTVQFFRAPMDGDLSNQWIDRISKHNSVVPERENLDVCQRHFTIADFIPKRGVWVLKNDAVPSVFGEAAKSAKILPKLVPSTERSMTYKSTLQTRRYCKIKYCENEVGVNSKEMPFFSVPLIGKKRLEWIKTISRYQEFDFFSPRTTICMQHFRTDDILTKNGRYILNKQAVPTIFPRTSHLNINDERSMQPQSIVKDSIDYKQLIDGRRICKIFHCPNEKRTKKGVSFFRAPMVGDLRIQWIDAILTHQQYDTFSIGFMVCELHFPAEALIVKNERKFLKRDVIPSIFDIKPMMNCQNIPSTAGTTSNFDASAVANEGDKPHQFEFIGLNECIVKSEPMDESEFCDQKIALAPEAVESLTTATHDATKRANTFNLACNNCDELNDELQKAREKISSLEKCIKMRNKTIQRQRTTIRQLKNEKIGPRKKTHVTSTM